MSTGDNDSSQFQSILLSELQNLRRDVSSLRDDLHGEVTSIRETVAHLKATEKQQDKQIYDFRSDVWNPLQKEIADVHNRLNWIESSVSERISSIEKCTKDIEYYKSITDDIVETVKQLEKSSLKRQGMAAGLGVAGGGGVAALIRYILSAIN